MATGVYSGLADLGQLRAKIGLGFAVCIGLVLCASGGMTISSALNDKHTKTVTATLSNTTCTLNACTSIASYNVGGKSYTLLNFPTNNPAPKTVTVSYNPSNPSDSQSNQPSLGLGIGLLVAALFVMICGYVVYKLTMSFKPLAAVEGADMVYGLGKSLV
jgi:hypothetical protein